SEIARVRAFVEALHARDFARMGQLLKESHRSLRDDFEVSTANVDALVARADAIDGCYGARIMGAGFGGSVLALVDHAKTEQFVGSMRRPVLICTTADGAFAAQGARRAHSK
ncbi:MAG TPA: galactokinase, partial [Candidatus Dormibacteraeota bacterium]|nr:galactokinase [Candidatus Dormibacteraeota bacterium]